MNNSSPATPPHSSPPTYSFRTSPYVTDFHSSHKNAITHIEWLLKMWLPKYALTYENDIGEHITVGNLVSRDISIYDSSIYHPNSCSTVDCGALEPSCHTEPRPHEINSHETTLVEPSLLQPRRIEANTLVGSHSCTESNTLIEFRDIDQDSLVEIQLNCSNSPTESDSCSRSNPVESTEPTTLGTETLGSNTPGSNELSLNEPRLNSISSNHQIDPQLDSLVFNNCLSPSSKSEIHTPGDLFLSVLQPIFLNWGIDLYDISSDEITYKIHELMVVTRSLTGTVGKKTAVVVLKELYPARRKYFPYASGYCPGEFWPGSIRYCDPSHLNREERFALLIWAYTNPDHNMNTIIAAHERLRIKHNIEIQKEAELVISQLRKAIDYCLSSN